MLIFFVIIMLHFACFLFWV